MVHPLCLSCGSIHNSSPGQIIWAKFQLNPISREDAHKVHSHLASYMSEHPVAVFELYPEHCIGQRLNNGPFHLDPFFLRHSSPFQRVKKE